jgi:protein ImuB
VASRLGGEGVRLQKVARGEQVSSFVAEENEPEFRQSQQLEYPVTLLDSLSFIVASLLESVSKSLHQRSLGTNQLQIDLSLDPTGVHTRTIKLPNPTLDNKFLLRLIQLDLQSHPPSAPVLSIALSAEPVRLKHVQGNLFASEAPEPDRMQLTLARLVRLVGESEVGSPELLDTKHPNEYFRVVPFAPLPSHVSDRSAKQRGHYISVRVYIPPKQVMIGLRSGVPVQVKLEGKCGEVIHSSGPWLTTGEWWNSEWHRKEWDVKVRFTSGNQEDYRIYFDLTKNAWFLDGIYD